MKYRALIRSHHRIYLHFVDSTPKYMPDGLILRMDDEPYGPWMASPRVCRRHHLPDDMRWRHVEQALACVDAEWASAEEMAKYGGQYLDPPLYSVADALKTINRSD